MSMAHAGPGPQTAPDAYTFADDAPRPVPTVSSTSSTQWSRPIRIHVCSVFVRMPRYGPAPPGIRSEARMRATGQSGSSRHVLALFDSSSRRINEQSSGLLIRGFGVQVPGGAPVLTWGFVAPGRFFVSVFCHVCSWVWTQQSGACQIWPLWRRMRSINPNTGHCAPPTLTLLRWTIGLDLNLGRRGPRPKSPCQGRRSVRPAGEWSPGSRPSLASGSAQGRTRTNSSATCRKPPQPPLARPSRIRAARYGSAWWLSGCCGQRPCKCRRSGPRRCSHDRWR